MRCTLMRILMSGKKFNIIECVLCVMFMSPLFFVTLILCVDLIASSYLKESTMILSNQNNPSNMNLSRPQNIIMDQTNHPYSMDNTDRSISSSTSSDIYHSLSATKDTAAWYEEFLKHLQYDMRNNSSNFTNNLDSEMLRFPFYNNYEDYFLPLNDSIDSILDYLPTLNESKDIILDEYDNWDGLNYLDKPNDYDNNRESNYNLEGGMSSLDPFLSILSNMNGSTNKSISLSDILITHHLNSIISKQNKSNYEENTRISDNSINLPPWENLTALQKDAILQSALGNPQKYSNGTVTGLSFYYGVLLFVGIPGNGLTILIIVTNSYMRTAPNIFLLNIAFADLLTLTLVAPLEIKMLLKSYPWTFGELGCAAATTLCELLTHVLIVTMIAFAFERYFAICHPLKPSLQSGKVRTMIIILVIWIICLIPSLCWTVYSKVEYMFYSMKENPRLRVTKKEQEQFIRKGFVKVEESATCVVTSDSVTSSMASMTVMTTLFLYVLPVLILPWIYSRIAKALKESENYSQGNTRQGNCGRNRRTVVRMQMAVIACFLICWTPYHVQRMMFVILTRTDSWSSHLMKIQETLHIVSGCCYFLSSAINPFLYSLLSKRFRRGFHDLTHKVIKNWKNRSSSSTRGNKIKHQAVAKASTLPNNFSFCFKRKQVNNRNTLKRHFNLPNSSVAYNAHDLIAHQKLELEMQELNNQNIGNSLGYKSSTDGLSEQNQITVEKLNHEDIKKIGSMLKQKQKHLNCKYKVVFKSPSNQQSTTLIVNTKNVENTIIPRYSGINDLRQIGTTSLPLVASSVTYINGCQSKREQVKFNSLSDEKCNRKKPFLNSLSSQQCCEV